MAGLLWRWCRPALRQLHDGAWYVVRTWSPHLRRRQRRARPDPVGRGLVLHVTHSFDVGGTQTQIQRVCEAPNTRYQHAATEIVPELNYGFRSGAVLDERRYGRVLGRVVAKREWRGFPLVQVYKLFRDFRADRPLAVMAWGHETCVTTFVAATLARVPHIVFGIRTFNPAYGWTDPVTAGDLQRAHRAMSPLVSGVIANSTVVRDDHAAWVKLDPSVITVCHNGAPPSGLSAEVRREVRAVTRASLGIDDDATVIANVGRFSKEKGQHALVDAARALAARVPSLHWLLVGDGPTLASIRAAAAAAGLTNMIFTGRTPHVRAMLAAADLFVMPSDFEGQPNAMMEAMAMGLPSVSTDRSGAVDIARDGVEALYYRPGDTAKLVEHLSFLVANPGRAHALGQAARERSRDFDVPGMVACFENALDRAVHGAPA